MSGNTFTGSHVAPSNASNTTVPAVTVPVTTRLSITPSKPCVLTASTVLEAVALVQVMVDGTR